MFLVAVYFADTLKRLAALFNVGVTNNEKIYLLSESPFRKTHRMNCRVNDKRTNLSSEGGLLLLGEFERCTGFVGLLKIVFGTTAPLT